MAISKNYHPSPADLLDHLDKVAAVRAVADAGSIHGGSRVLHIAQPSLSTKIKKLEEVLGVALFHRSARGVRVTDAGALVVDLARRIERSATEVRAKLGVRPGALAGTVRVGVYDSVARYLWPRFYRRFVARFPAVSLPVSTARSSELLTRLRRGAIDLALTIEAQPHGLLKIVDLFTDRFSLYAHRGFLRRHGLKPRANTTQVSRAAIASLPMFVFRDALAEQGGSLHATLNRLGVDERQQHDVASFEVALEFCREDMGVAVLPNQVARMLFERGALVKLAVEGLTTIDFGPHRICLSVLRESEGDPVIEAVTRELTAAVQPAAG